MKINPKRESVEQRQGLHDMCRWLRKRSLMLDMVEIGSWMGESSLIFSNYFGVVVCVDPFAGKFKKVLPIFLEAIKSAANIELIKQDGIKARDSLPGRFDFVYIDAVHEYEPVKSDIEYWRYRPAAIGGHDYSDQFTGVKQAVDDAFGKPDKVFQDTSWVKVLR